MTYRRSDQNFLVEVWVAVVVTFLVEVGVTAALVVVGGTGGVNVNENVGVVNENVSVWISLVVTVNGGILNDTLVWLK